MQEIDHKNKLMKKAGKICGDILAKVANQAKEGISLYDLDEYAEQLCYDNGAEPAFKGYQGFPATLCTGVNDVVVHGIPDAYVLKSGDIVSLDFGIKYKKVFSDTAYTVTIGKVSKDVELFINTVKMSLYNAIAQAKTGNSAGDIGYAIQNTVEMAGYSVVKEMVGHSIGYALHEDPYIPGYGKKGSGPKLFTGQTIAIEAIINKGGPGITISHTDGWTSCTKDGSLSALFEHTVLVGEKPEILTDSDLWR